MSRLLLPVLIIIRTLIMCMLFYYRSWINFTVLFRPARSRKVGRVWEMAPCGVSLLLASEAKLGRALQTTRRHFCRARFFLFCFFFCVSLVYSAARRRCFSCHFRRVRFLFLFHYFGFDCLTAYKEALAELSFARSLLGGFGFASLYSSQTSAVCLATYLNLNLV